MKHRCSALDSNGRQCRLTAKYKTEYHGDDEIYNYQGPEPQWVHIYFYDRHIDSERKKKSKRI